MSELCRSCVNTLKKRRSLIEQLKQIEERFKSFHQSTKVTSPCTGLKRNLQDEDVTSGKKTHIAESEGDEQVSKVAINVLQSTPVKSSSSINPKFVCLESPIKANQATIERITFIRTPKNQSQNTIIYSTNHELSPEFLRTASCLKQTNTLICIDGNNTHSVFPSMLRRLISCSYSKSQSCLSRKACWLKVILPTCNARLYKRTHQAFLSIRLYSLSCKAYT